MDSEADLVFHDSLIVTMNTLHRGDLLLPRLRLARGRSASCDSLLARAYSAWPYTLTSL